MSQRVRVHEDTIHAMANWAARKYGLRHVSVFYRGRINGKNWQTRSGCTVSLGGGRFLIELNEHRSYSTLIQVMAHELAHCVTLKRDRMGGHGPKFVSNHMALVTAWNAYAAERR